MALIDKEQQMKPKTGRWIIVYPLGKNFPAGCMCSECENGDWDIKPTDTVCKFCGANMRYPENPDS